MTDYAETLKKIEEATKVISDDSLRRIAFEQLLKHELSPHKSPGRDKQLKEEPAAPEESATKTRRVRNKGTAAGASPGIREEVKQLQISPAEEGLPPWGPLGALDKYLCIIEAAEKKHVDGLSAAEISWLIFEIFRDNHKPEQVGNIRTRIKRGHVRTIKIPSGTKKFAGYQILKGGKEYLKTQAATAANE
jgi:hypothetical protein